MKSFRKNNPPNFSLSLIVSIIVACCISLLVIIVGRDFGITWDEPIYFSQAGKYIEWLKHPDIHTTKSYFQVTSMDLHPPMRKFLGGITHELFTNLIRRVDNTTGYRMSSIFFTFPFILIFTFISIRLFGYFFGILGPFMLSLMPHVLFLSPLLTMDYAIMSVWFIIIVLAWEFSDRLWGIVLISFCLAVLLLSKLYGLIIILPLYMAFIFRCKQKAARNILLMLLVTGVMYVSFWPFLWTSPVQNFIEYIRMQTTHQGVPVYALHQTYDHVPSWYVPLMLVSTTPLYILVYALIGACALRKGDSWCKFVGLNAAYPVMFFMVPFVYRYDGVRLFLPSFPFIVLLSLYGVSKTIQHQSRLFIIGMKCLYGAIFGLTIFHSVVLTHPWESSYFNELIGGIKGAKTIGLEVEYWGNSYFGILPWMNSHKAFMMCVYPTTQPFYYYQAMGTLEPGVVFNAGEGACTHIVLLMRQGMFKQYVWDIINTQKAVMTVSLDGVPLTSVYTIIPK